MAQTAPLFLREDMAIIQVSVSGVKLPAVYSWAYLEGGILEANSVFTRPGGMKPGIHLGGPPERGDVTIRRQMTPELQPYIILLEDVTGTASCAISYTWLDQNKQPAGGTNSFNGVLKAVQRPNYDANNTAAAFLGLVIAPNQQSSHS